MAKRISLQIDDWIFDEILSRRNKGTSLSSRVRELLIKGSQVEKKEVKKDAVQKKL
jgi:hypothetical protein